jgi:hypothetical protein
VPGELVRRCGDLYLHAQSGWCSVLVALARVVTPLDTLAFDAMSARVPEADDHARRHARLYWECLAPWADRCPPTVADVDYVPSQHRNRPGLDPHTGIGAPYLPPRR